MGFTARLHMSAAYMKIVKDYLGIGRVLEEKVQVVQKAVEEGAQVKDTETKADVGKMGWLETTR